MKYKLYSTNFDGVVNAAMYVDGTKMVSFLFDETNTDYQEYLKWLDEGNTPEPADDPSTPE